LFIRDNTRFSLFFVVGDDDVVVDGCPCVSLRFFLGPSPEVAEEVLEEEAGGGGVEGGKGFAALVFVENAAKRKRLFLLARALPRTEVDRLAQLQLRVPHHRQTLVHVRGRRAAVVVFVVVVVVRR